jgi:predicted small secreted protein
MIRKLFVCLLFTLIVNLVGCETFKGLGRDVQKAGNWIEDTANR